VENVKQSKWLPIVAIAVILVAVIVGVRGVMGTAEKSREAAIQASRDYTNATPQQRLEWQQEEARKAGKVLNKGGDSDATQ